MKSHKNRPTLDWAKQKFADIGVELLASEYINNATKMPYQCKCGEVHYDNLANFTKRGVLGCQKKHVKLSYSFVNQVFKDAGCTLLNDMFKDSNSLLDYICSCGRESKTTFANFYHKGARCFECGKEKISGPNNYQWLEDRENLPRMSNPGWRLAVFERDNFTCQRCGVSGVQLNAHHIFDYQHHEHLRDDVSNGVTLCKECHIVFHQKHGSKTINTDKQLSEFIGGSSWQQN